jgi:3-phenylpropionate/trans-cinnamate dioxygenase ferredoxin subunit
MGFVKLASTTDVKPNEMKGFTVNGEAILLVNLAGVYYAIGNRCTHMGCMLSNGTLKNDTVQCMCHSSVFNLKTGNVIKGLAMKPEPKYELKVEAEQVLINL